MPTILVVDDEPALTHGLSELLNGWGYSTLVANDGKEALATIRKGDAIDIVLADCFMPRMDGLELLRAIKRDHAAIEVIIMTAQGTIELAVDAVKAGAFDFVTKPLSPTDLQRRIEQCLARLELQRELAQIKRQLAAMAGPVFLSYAREDVELVRSLYSNLRATGFDAWMDVQDLRPGQQWQKAIAAAIRRASFFLACLSNHSVSKRGMVQKELRLALDVWEEYLESDVYVIPVRLSECAVPPQLARFQWVDYFAANGWDRLEAGLLEGLRHRSEKGHQR